MIDLFGEGKDRIPKEHLVRFTSINCGKKVPAPKHVQDFWKWIQERGLVNVFPSISSLLCRQGLPDAGNPSDKVMQKLNGFINLFGEGKDSIPREHLIHFTSINSGKGVPDAAKVKAFWQWIKKKELTKIFPSISNLLCKQRLPDAGNVSD